MTQEFKQIVRGPFIESQIIQLCRDGYYKMFSCICQHCKAENIADNFSDACTGRNLGETMDKANWHNKDCLFISQGLYTKFSAYVVYVN